MVKKCGNVGYGDFRAKKSSLLGALNVSTYDEDAFIPKLGKLRLNAPWFFSTPYGAHYITGLTVKQTTEKTIYFSEEEPGTQIEVTSKKFILENAPDPEGYIYYQVCLDDDSSISEDFEILLDTEMNDPYSPYPSKKYTRVVYLKTRKEGTLAFKDNTLFLENHWCFYIKKESSSLNQGAVFFLYINFFFYFFILTLTYSRHIFYIFYTIKFSVFISIIYNFTSCSVSYPC